MGILAGGTVLLLDGAGRRVLGADAGSAGKGLVGSNVYGWTQYAQRDGKPFDIEGVMSALRDAGYDYLEANLDSQNPDKNGELAGQMKARGLKPVTLYTGARVHEAGVASETVARIAKAAKVARAAGFELISCNPDPIGREKTDAELKNQASALQDLGACLKELGMKLGIHHHTPELASQGREFRHVFDHTDPSKVGFCYDVHWVFRGGIAPLDALKQYGSRVVSWHIRQSRDKTWWEDLDEGDIDYSFVAKWIGEHELARVYTVELAIENGTKITRTSVENHRRSREFIRKVFKV
jgi:inosose dehydratase